MIADYLDAKETGSSKNRLELTIDIKADKVMDFAHEIRDAVVEEMLEVIDEIERDTGHVALIGDDGKFIGVLCNSSEFRDRVLALKGGEQE